MSIKQVTKALAGAEDLLLGEGTETQTRGGVEVVVNKVSGASLPLGPASGETIKEAFDELTGSEIASIPAGNLGATTIQDAVNELDVEKIAYVDSITSLHLREGTHDGQQIRLKGWHVDSDKGGGVFYWDATKLRSEHNGGTIISPTVPDVSATAIGDYLSTTGTGVDSDAGSLGVWIRQYEGVVNVQWFGAVGDGVADDTVSIQAAVDLLGTQALDNIVDTAIYLPRGKYVVSSNIWIYQLDGLRIIGDGLQASQLLPSASFTVGTIPAEFIAIEGTYRDYSYASVKAVFVVASRRVTGGSDGDINVGGANAAAWLYAFNGLGFIGAKVGDRVNCFYAPEIAMTEFTDIYAQYVDALLMVSDVYRSTMVNCSIFNSVRPLNHFSTASHVASGTTFRISNCGASRVTYGWVVSGLLYSAWDNVAVDHWGRDQIDTTDKPAYAFHDSHISLAGCGAETTAEDLATLNCKLLVVTGDSKVTHNACNYVGKFTVADAHLCEFSGTSSNIFDNSFLHMQVGGVAAKASLTESARVTHNNLFGQSLSSLMFDVQSTDCQLHALDANQKQNVTFSQAGHSMPAQTAPDLIPHTVESDPQLLAAGAGTGFTCLTTGVYTLDWTLNISGQNWQYYLVAVNGVTDTIIFVDNVVNKRYAESLSLRLSLEAGDLVQWKIRGIDADTSGMVDKSTIVVTHVR